jgi:hypothetical protein
MAEKGDFSTNIITPYNVTIPANSTTSGIFDCCGVTLKTIIMPATFTGTQISFQVSPDGSTFYDYYNINNALVSISCTQNRAYGIGAIDFYSIKYLKIVSNATESADRVFTFLTKPI